MLPNLAALRHRAPLARTGPQVPVDRDCETCPISFEDLPNGTPAWQPEVSNGGGAHVENAGFYDIVALARWLATSPHVTTPLTRGRVTPKDRRDLILAANLILEERNQPLLPVPPPPVPPPGSDVQTHREFLARLYEDAGRDLFAALETYYHLPNGGHASAAGLRLWLSRRIVSVQQTYALWHHVVLALHEALDAPETLWQPDYEPAQDAWFVRRAAGRMQTYFSQYVSQRTYARARAEQIDKCRNLYDAVQRYAETVLRPEGIVETSHYAAELAAATRDGNPLTANGWAAIAEGLDAENWRAFKERTQQLIERERRAAIDAWMLANNGGGGLNMDEWVGS